MGSLWSTTATRILSLVWRCGSLPNDRVVGGPESHRAFPDFSVGPDSREWRGLQVADSVSPKVIGVAGQVRSGSTLLTMLLGGSPVCFAAGEANRIWNHQPAEVRSACWCENLDCPFWTTPFLETCSRYTYRNIAERAMAIFGRPVTVISDKFPRFYVKQLRRRDQLDGLVVVFKSPEEFIYSMHKRGASFDEAAWGYRKTYKGALRLAKKGYMPTVFVEYRALASNTEEVVKTICGVFDIHYSADMSVLRRESGMHMLGGSGGLRARLAESATVPVAIDESCRSRLPGSLRERVAADKRLTSLYENLRLRADDCFAGSSGA